MKRFGMKSFMCSILVVISYLSCTLLSYFHYPLPYSPGENWLSDLGNRALNPTGAIFYNTGIVLTAFWLLLFFLSLSVLKAEEKKIQNLMVLLMQSIGILGCGSMALSAFFTIANPGLHSLLSGVLYIGIGTAFVFSAAALRYDPRFPKWLLVLGILTALFDLLTSVFFNTVPVFEWVTVSLFLTYVLLLGASMICLENKPVM